MSAYRVTKTAVFGSFDLFPNDESTCSNIKSSSSTEFQSFTSTSLEAVSTLLSEFCEESGVLYDNAKVLSISERTATYQQWERLNYTYGEVTIASMARIFDLVYEHRQINPSNMFNQIKGGKFCDLGSGSGIPVFMAAMLHPFDHCHGIEILTTLHDMAIKGKNVWDSNNKYKAKLSTPVYFSCGSITDLSVHDWTDSDFIFVNSTCFDNALIQEVDKMAHNLRAGAYIVTLSQQLSEDAFELVAEDRLEMSWGMADVYCHMRRLISTTATSALVTTASSTTSGNITSLTNAHDTSTENDITEKKSSLNLQGTINSNIPNTSLSAITISDTTLKIFPVDPGPPKSELTVVAISDTHGLHRLIRTVPPGDILIHAGDFTETGQLEQINDFFEWMHTQPHRYKFVIAGNHEITLQADYYRDYGCAQFHRVRKYDTAECRQILEKYPDVVYLEDSAALLEFPIVNNNINDSSSSSSSINTINSISQQHTTKVHLYGSPWQPEFCKWAFNLNRGEEIRNKWSLIPDNTDTLITHGPPIGYGDKCSDGSMVGCRDLLNEIRNRVHPRLHIFGHIHEGYGVYTDSVSSTPSTLTTGSSDCLYVNASTCNERYRPINAPIVIRYPLDKSISPSKV